MVRVHTHTARLRWKRRILKRAKGFWGGRGNLHKQLWVTLRRAERFAFRDRRAKKREFRGLWITRLNAAVREHGLNYSQFMGMLKKEGVTLNRKQLSEMAIADPKGFSRIVELAKKAGGKAA